MICMQGRSAVPHQGKKIIIPCKDKRQTILIDNFSIERRQILKQKVGRSGISTKHSRHERGKKNVLAIKQQEIVRRRVSLGYVLILSSPQPVQVVQVAPRVILVWSIQRFKYHHSKNKTDQHCAGCTASSTFIILLHHNKKKNTTKKTGQMGEI